MVKKTKKTKTKAARRPKVLAEVAVVRPEIFTARRSSLLLSVKLVNALAEMHDRLQARLPVDFQTNLERALMGEVGRIHTLLYDIYLRDLDPVQPPVEQAALFDRA